MILFLFTSSYPYDYAFEYAFIQPEIRYLLDKFAKVVLVPRITGGKRFRLPSNVEVGDSYSDLLQRNSRPDKMLAAAFSMKGVFREVRSRPTILLSPSKITKLILFSSRAELTRRWMTDRVKTQHVNTQNCMFYSYWFDHATTGFAMMKQEFPDIKLVSRAHGYDIYEEYYYPYYWPYRHDTLGALDRLFFASDAGHGYLRERYAEYASKFETAHLGIEDPAILAKPSADGVFRIVSCANIVPVKRIDLLLDGIAAAARMRPRQTFEWVHFGDGAGQKSLAKKLKRRFPANAQARLLGNVPNIQIMQHYRDQPVDVFVNVSSTEGGAPVAIQEAISCGIPVVATSVGGNPEVVSEKNGILLNPDPTPQEIAAGLLKIWDDPRLAARMRIESRLLWQTSYNAEVNFRAFAERLKSIGER